MRCPPGPSRPPAAPRCTRCTAFVTGGATVDDEPHFARVALPEGTAPGTIASITPTRIIEGMLA